MNMPVGGIAPCLASLVATLLFVSLPACAGTALAGAYKITENVTRAFRHCSNSRRRIQPSPRSPAEAKPVNTQAAIAFERPARAFAANHRQVDPQVNFLTRGGNYERMVTAHTTILPLRRTSCTTGESS